MPELPEVETIANGLRQTVLGRRILSVTLGKTDFIDDPAALEHNLPGKQIASVDRYGKFMLLRLTPALNFKNGSAPNEETNVGNAFASLLVHLGMTGHLAPQSASHPCAKHTHACFLLDDGRELRYTDARRFGRMAYLAGQALEEELRGFGADPLEVSVKEFDARVRTRRARIKALLLDQSVLRGVGNIYADESLWKAKIHPTRLGTNLTRQQAKALHLALRAILQKAIAMRGSSISDFLDAEGEPGEYQRHHRAYGREGKPCYRCRTPIRRAIVAGRSSYFCPHCQPSPRHSARMLPLRKRGGMSRKKAARSSRRKGRALST